MVIHRSGATFREATNRSRFARRTISAISRVGDTLCLRDWVPDRGLYRHEITGKQEAVVMARVNYLLYGGTSVVSTVGLKNGYVAMGLKAVRVMLNHGPGTNDGADRGRDARE